MISTESLKQRVGRGPYVKRLAWDEKGREYRATCPWHPDGEPSLTNYLKDGQWLFTCFPCKKSGDVISFVMECDGVSFKEAMQRIQDENGITDQNHQRTSLQAAFQAFKYDKDAAISALQSHADGLAYLQSRGISPECAKTNNLGLVEYPGIGAAISIPYRDKVVKFRALKPPTKSDKFRHLAGHPSKDLLYGIDLLSMFDTQVFVVESELDCLTMWEHGFAAVSVSSATTCLQKGDLVIRPEDLEKLQADDRKIILAVDQDAAGRACAEAFERVLPADQVSRLEWEYKKDSTDPKDIGELFTKYGDQFYQKIDQLLAEARNRPAQWRQQFRTVGQLESGGVRMLVERFMPEGTCLIGALSGHGKTLMGLSIAKALTTGAAFLGVFPVSNKVPVLYLIPESSGRAFKTRLQKFGIPDNENLFLCRTLSDGPTLLLNDPAIKEAVRQLRPVVILDTAIRFSKAESENDAIENQQLVNDIIDLRATGAVGVIGIHHSTKASATEKMTLENVLRGTGDLGAMCDAVYGIRRDEPLYDNGRGPNRIEVVCVKPRDFEPPIPFTIAATYQDGDGAIRSHIDEHGDLAVLVDDEDRTDGDRVADWIEQNHLEDGATQATVRADKRGMSNARKDAGLLEAVEKGRLVKIGAKFYVRGARTQQGQIFAVREAGTAGDTDDEKAIKV